MVMNYCEITFNMLLPQEEQEKLEYSSFKFFWFGLGIFGPFFEYFCGLSYLGSGILNLNCTINIC